MNARVLGNRLKLLNVNGGKFEINQLLFPDDKELVADSEEKLCKLVSEFCRHEKVIVPMTLYGAEAWGMRSAERRKFNVLEMKSSRIW